jgi:hypothetical protein
MPEDVTVVFLHLILLPPEVLRGNSVDGAAFTVPGWLAPVQLDALQEAARAAAIRGGFYAPQLYLTVVLTRPQKHRTLTVGKRRMPSGLNSRLN